MPAPKKSPTKKKPENENPDDPEDTQDDPEDETPDDPDAAAEENRRINAIVTSRVKREMKGVLSQLAQLNESIKGLSPAKKPEDPDDEDPDLDTKPEQDKVDPKLSRKMTKLERELADERSKREKAERERAEELDRGKRSEMRNQFQSVLTELGVTSPRLLRAALDQLEQDGVMFRDEDGKIKFKGVDKYGIETNFDPKAGLKTWVTTEGKEFIPAVEAGGSGTGGTRGTGNGTQSLSSKEFNKLTEQQRASINLERACSGLPPLGEE